MKRRKLGRRGPEVSALGFGVMRMPVKDGVIDRELGRAMILESYRAGVDYWDTAWPYHDGDSEQFIGEILGSDDAPARDDIVLATKLPSWLVKREEDLDRYFNEQLKRLGTSYVDVYLLHTLNKEHWENLKKLGALEWLQAKKDSGQVKYAGFSFHDGADVFTDIVRGHDWDVCQIQYNYMDEYEQAGREGLELAHELGIGVIIMEPLQGGNLVKAPERVAEIWARSGNREWTPVERSLRWLWDQKEVGMVLSGMSTMDHVKENCRIAGSAETGDLSPEEKTLYTEAREVYQSLKAVGCTGCRYCLPCPEDVDIPWNFKAFNQAAMFGNLEGARGQYEWMHTSFEKGLSKVDPRGENCISCGVCEEKCPQQLKIASLMPEVAAVLKGEKEPAEAAI